MTTFFFLSFCHNCFYPQRPIGLWSEIHVFFNSKAHLVYILLFSSKEVGGVEQSLNEFNSSAASVLNSLKYG